MGTCVVILPIFPVGPLKKSDLWSREEFLQKRPFILPEIISLKKKRRIPIGPYATCLFENKVLIWWQIQEILRAEPNADLEEEIDAYAFLVPDKGRLGVTLFLEYTDPCQRKICLKELSGIERTVFFSFGANTIQATCDVEFSETACAVNFLTISFTEKQVASFCDPITLFIRHPHYTHTASLERTLWEALYQDISGISV